MTTHCEICKQATPIVEHHIHSITYGGTNLPYNKCRICPNCHSLVHYGKIIIEGRFESTGGNIVVHRKQDEQSITGFKDPIVWIYNKGIQNETTSAYGKIAENL